jgi:hypothetical protein
MFDEKRKKLTEILKYLMKSKDCGRISSTTDIWTASHQGLCYAAVTIHFIYQWKLYSLVIAFPVMPFPHTGELIAESIFEVLKSYGIMRKFLSFTLDNASNNTSLIKYFRIFNFYQSFLILIN